MWIKCVLFQCCFVLVDLKELLSVLISHSQLPTLQWHPRFTPRPPMMMLYQKTPHQRAPQRARPPLMGILRSVYTKVWTTSSYPSTAPSWQQSWSALWPSSSSRGEFSPPEKNKCLQFSLVLAKVIHDLTKEWQVLSNFRGDQVAYVPTFLACDALKQRVTRDFLSQTIVVVWTVQAKNVLFTSRIV